MTQVEEKGRIAVAKAIMTARGLNPDTLCQHRDWEDWPTDAEQGSLNNQMQPTTIKLHYAWRRALPWADAAILAYEAAKAAPKSSSGGYISADNGQGMGLPERCTSYRCGGEIVYQPTVSYSVNGDNVCSKCGASYGSDK